MDDFFGTTFNELFNTAFGSTKRTGAVSNYKVTDKGLEIEIDMPGSDDVSITAVDGYLKVTGTRRGVTKTHTFSIAACFDEHRATGTLKNGVLTVVAPSRSNVDRETKIPITR